MSNLRKKLIRLAYQKPELRSEILPLLKTASPMSDRKTAAEGSLKRPHNLGYDWKMDIFSPKGMGRNYGHLFVGPDYELHGIGDERVTFSNNGVHFSIKYESDAQLKKILSKMKNKGGKDHQGTPWKNYLT